MGNFDANRFGEFPPVSIGQLEPALWSRYKIRIRGGGGVPSGIRLSTPYYIEKADIDGSRRALMK